ncbi:MAG: Radical domain protein [Verrucomicrobiales bacterium]|nr:Radical domain protein [Verrucomicrobiales bacterium]
MPPQAEIVLATLNASYQHAAFGLRYLMANLGDLQSRAAMLEFTINQRISDIVEAILSRRPVIVGLGVYIWNVRETTEVVSNLRRLRPDLRIVLGGPEVSYEWEGQPIVELADVVITGEADLTFPEVCRTLLAGGLPPEKVIAASLPKMEDLALPYHLYSPEDAATRLVYLEASRGCPFTCEFCLSSLAIPVRSVPLERMQPELERLLAIGVRHFKFVDRTFNLNLAHSRALLEFFLERLEPGLFLHFEMIPDRLPEGLREIIRRFPPGAMQFEIGIQTFNETASKNISRRNNHDRLADNFRFLRAETGVHLHADLIVGLPGEDAASFGRGFDRLLALRPQEIQVGILKRLRGTPIVRHDAQWGMVYSAFPPYEILENGLIPFAEMQRLRRFAKYWDLIGNSGNFAETALMVWHSPVGGGSSMDGMDSGQRSGGDGLVPGSPFEGMMRLCDWLHARTGQVDGLALLRLMELMLEFLTTEIGHAPEPVAAALWRDYTRNRRTGRPPHWLSRWLPMAEALNSTQVSQSLISRPATTRRQARHQTEDAETAHPGRPA